MSPRMPLLGMFVAASLGLTAQLSAAQSKQAGDRPRTGLAASQATLPANRWPFLRGPRFDGRSSETEIVDSFHPEGPPVLWSRPLGSGYSGFTAEPGRVFTQYQTLGGQFVVCLNADTGETVWSYRYEGPYEPAGLYPGPRATPSLAHGRVYFTSPSGLAGCLTADRGRLIWSFNVFERFGVKPVDFGYSSSPTIVDDWVLLPVGSPGASMVALRAGTGEVVWQAGNETISHVPALPITHGKRQYVIGYFQNALMAFHLKTGRVAWKMPMSSGYDEHAAWPIYSEPYLWISGPFRSGSHLLELTADAPGYRTEWKSGLMSNDVCSSVLVDGHLYGFDLKDVQAKPHRPSRGQFRCMEFLTGRECWSNGSPNQRRQLSDRQPADSAKPAAIGQATVLYADEKLILFNDVGELILARASPERYKELGRVRVLVGEICWTQPTLFAGRLYVRNHSRAACLLLARPESAVGRTANPQLTVADIPQSEYCYWAAILLPVEPEYAMDAPTVDSVWLWYLVSLGGYALAAMLARLVTVIWPCRLSRVGQAVELADAEPTGKQVQGLHTRKKRTECYRCLTAITAFVFGALGTTFVSAEVQRLVFTWPLCLFVAFQTVLYQTRSRSDEPPRSRWLEMLSMVLFLGTCLAYFLLCRRLSLAFEWVFLAGFPAAVPFLVLARRQQQRERFAIACEFAVTAIAFSFYYGASSGLLFWKYHQ